MHILNLRDVGFEEQEIELVGEPEETSAYKFRVRRKP